MKLSVGDEATSVGHNYEKSQYALNYFSWSQVVLSLPTCHMKSMPY